MTSSGQGEHLDLQPVYATQRSVLAFYVARSSSLIGDSAAAAALALLIYQRFGSTKALGVFFVAKAAPRLLGPLLGSLSDEYDLRQLLRACDAASAVLYAVIVVLLPGLRFCSPSLSLRRSSRSLTFPVPEQPSPGSFPRSA